MYNIILDNYKEINKNANSKPSIAAVIGLSLLTLFAIVLSIAFLAFIAAFVANDINPSIDSETVIKIMNIGKTIGPVIVIIGYAFMVIMAIIIASIDKKQKGKTEKIRLESAEKRINELTSLLKRNGICSKDGIEGLIAISEKRTKEKRLSFRMRVFIGILTAIIIPIWLDQIQKEIKYMVLVSAIVLLLALLYLGIDWFVNIPIRKHERLIEAMNEDLAFVKARIK